MTDPIFYPKKPPKFETETPRTGKSIPLISLFTVFFLIFVAWQLYQSSFLKVVKSICAGIFLIYYSWELIYFDSLVPGIYPPSPLSPSSIRTVSRHSVQLNYALAVIIGIFFTLYVNWYA